MPCTSTSQYGEAGSMVTTLLLSAPRELTADLYVQPRGLALLQLAHQYDLTDQSSTHLQ